MTDQSQEMFPWHLGVFDAHCHPTDTMDNLPSVPAMKAKVLTVMATRAQDQQLVAHAAEDMGIRHSDIDNTPEEWRKDHKVLPCFGWHPWFSHQMFDPSAYDNASTLSSDQKVAHYQSVLTPKSEDHDFLLRLPDPRSFSEFLQQTREYLERFPLALIGEVGLDKQFRIPEAWLPGEKQGRDEGLTPGGREGRKLSPYRVSMDHQKKVLLAQLRMAGELGRACSVHGVQAHGVVYETLSETWKGHERKVMSKREKKREANAQSKSSDFDDKEEKDEKVGGKPYPPRICLHSFSGPAEQAKLYSNPAIPADIYLSFSAVINFSEEDGEAANRGNKKSESAINAVPDDRILIESDLHMAGDRMDGYLEEIVRKICHIKGWSIEHGVKQLGDNWRRFVFGNV